MSRTTYIVNYTDAAVCEETIKSILLQEKYEYIFENGENVWKCGNGLWTAIKYIKYEFVDDKTLHLTGWVKADVGGELNLDGVFGGLPKKQAREVINRIKASVR